MREAWAEESATIRTELERLIGNATELALCQKGRTPRKLQVVAIEAGADGELLLLNKIQPFPAPPDAAFLLYHPPGEPMRGFTAQPVLETPTQLGIALPTRIIQIQRRRHPRIGVSSRCQAIFSRRDSQTINNGRLKDISAEGARLVGPFSEHIRVGDVITHLTMILKLRYGDYEERLTLPEATVKRRRQLDDDETELGIHFLLTQQDCDTLDIYLTLRALELDAIGR